MIFTLLMSFFSLSLDLLAILGLAESDKDLEIIILRQQVRILQPKVKTPPRISDPERMVLATLTDKSSQFTDGARQRLHQVMLIFKPDTVLRWHRELVRHKWTFKRNGKPGRPGRSSELEALTVRLAKENPHWGYDKIQGELLKLGNNLSVSSVRNILKRHRLTPASERSSSSWRSCLGHYKDQILACDFFTVETIWLKTIYVLFFIELGTRLVHLAGGTTNPDTTWVNNGAGYATAGWLHHHHQGFVFRSTLPGASEELLQHSCRSIHTQDRRDGLTPFVDHPRFVSRGQGQIQTDVPHRTPPCKWIESGGCGAAE